MKKILIALDYDPTAEKIAETGHQLAKAMDASVILLHVTAEAAYYAAMEYSPVMGFSGFNSHNMAGIVNNLKKGSEMFLKQSKEHLGDDNITTVVADGDTADTILSVAEEYKADIIVLGTHSRSGLDQLLMGSISKKVLQHSKVPLFIIPTKNIGQ